MIEIWYTDEKFSDLKAPRRLCPELPAMDIDSGSENGRYVYTFDV